MSRPSRGVVARRREGGAGCGTRERGQRKATSPGGGGEPSRGTKTAGRSDRSVEGVKPECRVARREDADARVMGVQGPGDPGPPVKNGPVWRNPGHAPSRRATPLIWGRQKETGKPRARPNPGPTKLGCLTIGYVFLRSPPRKRGPGVKIAAGKSGSPLSRGRAVEIFAVVPGERDPGPFQRRYSLRSRICRAPRARYSSLATSTSLARSCFTASGTGTPVSVSPFVPPQAGTQAFRQRVRP